MKQTDIPNHHDQSPAAPSRSRPRTPGAYLIGVAGGAAVALIGVWLIAAPFASGYQPDGTDWVEATTVGVVTGIGLLVAGLAVTALQASALRGCLVASGYAKPRQEGRPAASEPAAAQPEQGSKELEDLLVPLAAALLEDLRAEQATSAETDRPPDAPEHSQADAHPRPTH